jgi:hypothetical protein
MEYPLVCAAPTPRGSAAELAVLIQAAGRSLVLAASVPELKDVRDQAEAIRAYARQRDGCLEVQNAAAELKVRAERRLGELLLELDRNGGGRPEKTPPSVGGVSEARPATLDELGINYMQSSRWRQIAALPERAFEHFLETRKAEGEEITSADLLRLAAHAGETNRRSGIGYGHSDNFQTDPGSVYPLLPYLPPGAVVWECAWGRGQLADTLRAAGHPVLGSDLLAGEDFLWWAPAEPWDVIVTNPPYSLKDEFLARAYALRRPFAFLLPLTALEGQVRQGLFARHGVELLVLPHRPEFTTPGGTVGGSHFSCAWYTWNLGLPRQLNFVVEEP